MGVYIKGMDMPISCEKCPLCYDYLNCSIDDSLQMYLYNRHPNCPLIEIDRPHGRLIDRDDIYIGRWDIDSDLAEQIQNAPTILEAEEV